MPTNAFSDEHENDVLLPYKNPISAKVIAGLAIFWLIVGVIALVIEALSRKIRTSAANSLKAYFKSMQEDENVYEDNTLIADEQNENIKKTSFVKCPSCGANNVIHGKTGKCAFCKSNLENK